MQRRWRPIFLLLAALVHPWAIGAAQERGPAQDAPDGGLTDGPAPAPPRGSGAYVERSEERGPRALQLVDFLDTARRYYPSLDAADHAIEAARAQLREAEVSPFMQFSLDAGFAVVPSAEGTPIFSNDPQLNLGGRWGPAGGVSVQGVVPLYTFGKIRSLRRAARQGVRAADERRSLGVAELELDVQRAFFALQLALDVQQLMNEGLGRLEQATTRLEERLEQGDITVDPMDRYRMQAAVAEVRARASQAELLRTGAEAALRTLTGLTQVRIPDCPSQTAAVDLQPVTDYLADLDQSRPEGRMLGAAVQAREANLDLERGRYYPDLGIGLEAGITRAPHRTNINNPFIRDAGNFQTLSAGLVARWNLDLWGTHLRVRRRRAELGETRAQQRLALAGMELEVQEAYARLEDAQRRQASWGEGERATRRWFVASIQAYQVGTIEARQLIDAVSAYFNSRFNHLQAVHDFNVGAARLDKASGSRLVPREVWNTTCEE